MTDRLKDKFREKAVPLAAEIKDIIKKIDYVASNYKEDSEIAKINSLPNSTDIKVSNDLFKILEIADNISALTNNSYDIKLGKYSSSLGFSPTFNKDLSTHGTSFFLLIFVF